MNFETGQKIRIGPPGLWAKVMDYALPPKRLPVQLGMQDRASARSEFPCMVSSLYLEEIVLAGSRPENLRFGVLRGGFRES